MLRKPVSPPATPVDAPKEAAASVPAAKKAKPAVPFYRQLENVRQVRVSRRGA